MIRRRRFGRYELQREIGDGAMGRVYRCVDPLMLRIVAVKTVKTEFLTRDTRDEYLRRFRREAQAAGRLSHANIVGVYDVGQDFFVMEYLEGCTLQTYLRERGRLPLSEALGILTPLADALDYAHRSGIVHRDIKPANIMVVDDGRPKLMDFGVAHLESSIVTAAGHFFGSPSYMAPEQVSGAEPSAASDLFSFAVVAYEVITGHRPFDGESIPAVMYRVVNAEAPPPRHWDPELPPVFDDIFRRALHKDPQQRFTDATSMARALETRNLESALRSAPPAPARAPGTHDSGAITTPGLHTMGAIETHDLVAITPQPPPAVPVPRERADGSPSLGRGMALAAAGAAVALALTYFGGRAPRAPGAELSVAASELPFRIETEPPGAVIWLDGAEAGRAPVVRPQIEPGQHNVRVAAEGYATASLTFTVQPGVPPGSLRFVLDPMSARLDITSNPPGALVSVDGETIGETPLEQLPMPTGRHTVTVAKDGFAPWKQVVDGQAGQTVSLAPTLAERKEAKKGPADFGWVREGMMVPVDSSVTGPRKLFAPAAEYPKAAERLRLVGSVTVEMTVNEKGETEDVRVVQSAGEILDAAVVSAVRQWRYEPATKNGVKVKVRTGWKQTFVQPG
jgi:serine/threonine-protein kinase